jgi:endoglycosylceramidase
LIRLRQSALVLIALVVVVATQTSCSGPSTPPHTKPSQDTSLLPLHATRGARPAIVDSMGRQVLLRGVDFNALGDYFQANPTEAPVVPYSPSELDQMAAQGFNVIRLTISWSKLEPTRGRIDTQEIDRIRQVVNAAGARGLYVVLDMHQDAWGKYIATPPGVTCPPGTQAAIGWDGAPKWATITDGQSTCRTPGVRELSPAVITAFDNFYANRDGIQNQFIDVWAALATAFASDPVVAGYDLFNEPHFGSNPAHTNVVLASLYGRLIDRIRRAESSVSGGFSHIVFFEPNILWSGLGRTAVPSPSFTKDTNIVFAPHLYGGTLAPISVQAGYQAAMQAAATYGTTMWSGEWGGFANPTGVMQTLVSFARLQDQTLTGGAFWQWSQACGDPNTLNATGGRVPSSVMVFNEYSCPGSKLIGPVPQIAEVLSRSYPLASPGRLDSLSSEPTTGRLELSGFGDGTIEIWVPARIGRCCDVTGQGVGKAQMARVSGGWHVMVPTRNHYSINIAAL